MPNGKRAPLVLAGLTALTMLIAGCTATADDRDLNVIASEYSFKTPASAPSGHTRFRLTNKGTEAHQAQIVRINDGETLNDVQRALSEGDTDTAFSKVAFHGGPATVAAGDAQDITLDLAPGRHLLLCFLTDGDGAPHVAKGMIASFQVGEPTTSPHPAPTLVEDVRLRDHAIDLRAVVPAGAALRVTNDGPQLHEVALLRLHDGATPDDVFRHFSKPQGVPLYDDIGGMLALSAGRSAYFTPTLPPGRYLAICFLADPMSGKAHAELGMVKGFTVAE